MIFFRKTVCSVALLSTCFSAYASLGNNNNDKDWDDFNKRKGVAIEARPSSVENQERADDPVLSDEIIEIEDSSEEIGVVKVAGSTLDEIKPNFIALIQETIQNSRYEKRILRMDASVEEHAKFREWFWEDYMRNNQHAYPISVLPGPCWKNRPSVPAKVQRTFYVTINNYTLEQEKVRQQEAYEFYAGHNSSINGTYNFLVGDVDPAKINIDTFYNLIVHAGLTEDELNMGKNESSKQSPIDVLPFMLQSVEIEAAVHELVEILDASLKNSMKPLVIDVFNLSPDSQFSANQLITAMFKAGVPYEFRAQGADNQEKRVYLLLRNDLRKILDLHGLTVKESRKRVFEFIDVKYHEFETDFKIMTGKGNHSVGGISQLKLQLPQWLEDESVRDLIHSHGPDKKNSGIYNVSLHPPITLKNGEWYNLPYCQVILMREGIHSAARKRLDGSGYFYKLGEKYYIEVKGEVGVNLADEEKYLKNSKKQKKLVQATKAPKQLAAKPAKQPAAPKIVHKSAKQPVALKLAAKQVCEKMAPRSGKKPVVVKVAAKPAKQPAAAKVAPKAPKKVVMPKNQKK